jgi:glutathione synthase/RimK-type ligase-like ATP-grasp enzyme
MLRESHYLIRYLMRFILLPYCYLFQVNWRVCKKSRIAVAVDFLYIFFVLRNYPDNYGACRLWEVPREEWAKYFGSNYNPFQRAVLRRSVHPFVLERAFQDKEVCDGICRKMGLPVPEQVGVISPSTGASSAIREMLSTTLSGRLIIKPVNGHAGLGVALASWDNGRPVIRVGGRSMSLDEYTPPERCLVQKVLSQHQDVAVVAPSSMNTLRLLTMMLPDERVIIVGASMRFGVGDSFIDNWSAGGVAVGVDHREGTLMAHGFDKRGNIYLEHPVSGVRFAGFRLTQWSAAIDLGVRVQEAFPFFKLLGMDIGFTPDGPVLIEINNDADLVFQEQTSGPLLAARETWEAFREYALLYNAPQRRIFT